MVFRTKYDYTFKSFCVAQKFDTLPKGVCHDREECRKDFKNIKPSFSKGDSTELELPFLCSLVCVSHSKQLLLFCHGIQGLRGSPYKYFLGSETWKEIRICDPFALVLTAKWGYGDHLLLPAELSKLGIES